MTVPSGGAVIVGFGPGANFASGLPLIRSSTSAPSRTSRSSSASAILTSASACPWMISFAFHQLSYLPVDVDGRLFAVIAMCAISSVPARDSLPIAHGKNVASRASDSGFDPK